MNNSTTIQGDGKVVYIPVVVNGKQERRTNADRIRNMSDEELAELFTCIDMFCCPVKGANCADEPDCKDCFERWLKR